MPVHLTTGALSNHSHGNPTLALTNLSGTTASNSAGLTLSLSAAAPGAGGGIAATISGNTAGVGALISSGTMALAGGNNITLSQNGQSVTISGPTLTQYLTTAALSDHTHSQYLTTAALSNHSHNLATTTTNGSVIVVGTANSVGATIGVPAFLTTAQAPGAYLTTARASNDAVGLNTALTANGVSWTVNSSGLSLNVPAFLTTAAQSGHSHGNPTLVLTNLSGTTASNSAGLTLSLSAAAPGGGGSINFSAGTTSSNLNSVVFSNSNGVTFGLNGSTMTASHNGLTTAALSNHSHNFATTTTNGSVIVVGTANSVGATIGVPAFLTTAQAPGAYLTTARASNDAVGLNTALTGNGVAWTVNSSGLSLNVPAFLTTAALSNHSHGNPTLALTNLSGTTASNSAGLTLSLSAAAPGGGGAVNFSAGTTSNNLQTIVFSNSNGVSFGLNGSTMTASHAALTTAALSDHSHGNPTLALTNLSGTTASASNGLTISLSAGAPGGGAGATIYEYANLNREFLTTHAGLNITNASLSKRPIFFNMSIPGQLNGMSNIDLLVSRTAGTSLNMTVGFALYSFANRTSIGLVSSTTNGISLTTSAQWSGMRQLKITGLSGATITPGHYIGALYFSGSNNSTAVANLQLLGGQSHAPVVGYIFPGTNSTGATNSTSLAFGFGGVFSATTGAFPAAVAASQVYGQGDATVNRVPYVLIDNR